MRGRDLRLQRTDLNQKRVASLGTHTSYLVVQMFPPPTTAASLVPSLDEVMDLQPFVPPTEVSSVHVVPESVEVQMFPPLATAASLVPSLDEVMDSQFLYPNPMKVFSVHVAPESVEVQMFPPLTTAASLVPSLDEVMEYQFFALPVEVFSVHVAPESVEVRVCGGPDAYQYFPLPVLSPRGARVCGGPDVSVPNNGGEFGTVAR